MARKDLSPGQYTQWNIYGQSIPLGYLNASSIPTNSREERDIVSNERLTKNKS